MPSVRRGAVSIVGRKRALHPFVLATLALMSVRVALDPRAEDPLEPPRRNDAGPWKLEYRLAPDEMIRMKVRHRAISDTTVSGETQSVETCTDSTKVWKVTPGPDEGTLVLEHSVEDVRMLSRSNDRGSVAWDSGSNSPPPPGYEHVPASLGVPLARLTIDRSGHLLDRRNLKVIPESNTGDMAVVPLPVKPASIGDEWEVPQEMIVEVPGGPRKPVRSRLRYRLDAVRDGVATISVDTTVLTPIDDPRLEVRLLERIWDGTILFDVAKGRVIRRSTSMDRRVVGFSGEQSSLRYRAELEESLVP